MGIFARSRVSDSVLIAVVFFVPIHAAGQAPAAKPSEPAKPWTPKRTPDGQPDLQGFWSNSSITPMERPAALAGKEFYTEQEQAENEKRAQIPQSVAVRGGTVAHYDFVQYGLDLTQAKRAATTRTSLVVRPRDGRIPPMLPAPRQTAADRTPAPPRST